MPRTGTLTTDKTSLVYRAAKHSYYALKLGIKTRLIVDVTTRTLLWYLGYTVKG